MPKDLEQLKEYALSGDDLVRLVGEIEIIGYPDLDDYNSVEELFKKRNQVVVLFLTKSKMMGHWLALLLHPQHNAIEVFDSYGMKVDAHRKWLSPQKLDSLDERAPQIRNLIEKSKYQAVYNDTKLQPDGTNTCGRHVACRIMHSDMLLRKYIDLVKDSGHTPDDFVTLVTYRKLGK